ncbi:MAG: hypothetical protein QXU54_02920 [Candidatus Micrarchaeia archaeon]
MGNSALSEIRRAEQWRGINEFYRDFGKTIEKKPEEVQRKFYEYIPKCSQKFYDEYEVEAQIGTSISLVVDKFLTSEHFSKKSKEEQDAFRAMLKLLTPEVMYAYACHEAAWGGTPEEKIEYMRQMIKKHGELFLVARPSIHDKLFSVGMFQLTEDVAKDIYEFAEKLNNDPNNKRDKDKIWLPGEELKWYSELKEHTTAAAVLALLNIGIIIREARKKNLLKKLLRMLESEKATNKGTFMAGLLGAMHHKRTNYKKALLFIDKGNHNGDLAKNALATSFSGEERHYFSEASEIHRQLYLTSIVRKLGDTENVVQK